MERVLVLKSSVVSDFLNGRTGLIEIDEERAMELVGRAFFLDRSDAEHDENFRQVIPYVTIVDGERVLLMRRTRKQSERRLHDLYTIGVGGHVNEGDGSDPVKAFKRGMERELNEEVEVVIEKLEFVGLINSMENEVSRVHLGFFYVAFGEFKDVREKENFEWALLPLREISEYEGMMEGWSRIALNGLKSRLTRR